MKKLLTVCLTLLLMCCYATAKAEKHVYKGKVGPYPVTVTLNFGDETDEDGFSVVTGSYTYDKAGNTLFLRGNYNYVCRCPWMNLKEYTKSGKMSAEWSLDFTGFPPKTLTGSMTVSHNGKEYNVSLRKVR